MRASSLVPREGRSLALPGPLLAALFLALSALTACGSSGPASACGNVRCPPSTPTPRERLAQVRILFPTLRGTLSRLSRTAGQCGDATRVAMLESEIKAQNQDVDSLEARIAPLEADSYQANSLPAKRDVEERAEELEEQVRRTKTRIALLEETMRRCP